VVAATVAALTFGVSTQAEATSPPHNIGWLYTQSKSGAAFFDADLAGYPSYEKITVCDNKSDGRGIVAYVSGWQYNFGSYDWVTLSFRDPSNDGDCEAQWDNYFLDGYVVDLTVCEYWGTNEDNCATASGDA